MTSNSQNKSRDNWKENLIATAVLLGAEFEQIHPKIEYAFDNNRNRVVRQLPPSWVVRWDGHHGYAGMSFQKQYQCAYWYIALVHGLSFQINREMLPCKRGATNGRPQNEKDIWAHQHKTARHIRRADVEQQRKWRREQKNLSRSSKSIARGHTG